MYICFMNKKNEVKPLLKIHDISLKELAAMLDVGYGGLRNSFNRGVVTVWHRSFSLGHSLGVKLGYEKRLKEELENTKKDSD